MNRRNQLAIVVLLSVVSFLFIPPGVGAASSPSVSAPDAAYVQSYEKWKAELTDDLKQNWVPLAGLYWLKPGANSFGADPANAVVFPKGPAHAGEFDLEGKDVTMKVVADAHATVAGKPLQTAKLDSDVSGHPSLVEMNTLQFHVIVRGDRVGIRLKDSDSAAAHNFRPLAFYPLDMNYVVTATWEPSDGKSTIDIPNVLGDVTPTPIAGVVVFKINGQEVRLTDLSGDPAKDLFFVFNDLTAKSDTYPGGRFLYTEPVVDGKVVLDFNRAHNPPCAVTPYATCPLAPKENRLRVAIPAGEKFDKAAHAHH
ncbi:MAG: DUF1684 domain-containing protein [Candidatus Sulfotelmatobacter sp.]